MKLKLFLLSILLYFFIVAYSIEVCNGFSINGNIKVITSYVHNGDRIADESFQPEINLEYDSEYGKIVVKNWWSVSRGSKNDLYKETDLIGTYNTNDEIFKFKISYCNYFNFHNWKPQVELCGIIGGGKYFPLYIGMTTVIYNKHSLNEDYKTYLNLFYKYETNNWTIKPEIGVQCYLTNRCDGYNGDMFEHLNKKDYKDIYLKNISLMVEKHFFYHETIENYLLGEISLNLFDSPERKLEYGKNINLRFGIGFAF